MTAQTQRRRAQTWPREETGVLSQRSLFETSLSPSCSFSLRKKKLAPKYQQNLNLEWDDIIFLICPLLWWRAIANYQSANPELGILTAVYTAQATSAFCVWLVGANNNFGKELADKILFFRPDWIPFKLSKSIKQPRDFRDEDDLISLFSLNSPHVRHHQPAPPVLLLRRHFRPHHWSAPRK